MTILTARPCTIIEANKLVSELHRHHKPVTGHRFSIAAYVEQSLVGAAVVGRPVGREVPQYMVAEVTRLVTNGHRNACSFLYARCAQAAEAMGFWAIQTYTLLEESGASLRACGWEDEGQVRLDGKGWNNRKGRKESQPKTPKRRWRRYFNQEYRTIEKAKL